MRSHTASSSTANALASSERSSVTTETTIGSPWGETSNASFTHASSPAHRSSAPASKAPANVQRTRADSWKSPATGPSSRGAPASGSRPPGSRKRSHRAGAAITSSGASSRRQLAGATCQLSGPGSGGTATVIRSVSRASAAAPCHR